MTEKRLPDAEAPQSDQDLDGQSREESSSPTDGTNNMSDTKSDQIDPDDPQKAQKLTQTGRDYDVDGAEE